MKPISIRILPICLVLLLPSQIFGQDTIRQKILGTWAFAKIEFLRPNQDSASMVNNAKWMIITITEDKVILKSKFDSTITRSSGYTISSDGSTLTHNGMTATIARLTDEELVLNMASQGIIEHLKKVH